MESASVLKQLGKFSHINAANEPRALYGLPDTIGVPVSFTPKKIARSKIIILRLASGELVVFQPSLSKRKSVILGRTATLGSVKYVQVGTPRTDTKTISYKVHLSDLYASSLVERLEENPDPKGLMNKEELEILENKGFLVEALVEDMYNEQTSEYAERMTKSFEAQYRAWLKLIAVRILNEARTKH